jgi:proton-dependent oligopeptide transporter, POT family
MAVNPTQIPPPAHPRGIWVLAMTEMWERFTYYGMRALLVLFLVSTVAEGGFGLDDRTAAAIYGLYTAGIYLMALPGGWIADRLTGQRNAILAGGVLITAGNLALCVAPSLASFCTGLLVIAMGVGLLKPNASAIVGSLYPEGGARRDAGFSLFYMGINAGGFLGPIVAGLIAQHASRRLGFAVAALGMVIGLSQFWISRRHLGVAGEGRRENGEPALQPFGPAWYPLVGGLAVVFAAAMLLRHGVAGVDAPLLSRYTAGMIVAMAAAYFAYLLWIAEITREERGRSLVILVLFIASTLFWSGYEQAGSSLNLFAERYTDRTIGFLNWEMPAELLQAFPSLFVILFAPVFTWIWLALDHRGISPGAPYKFAFGLVLMGAGFLVMVGAAHVVSAGGRPLPTWLITTYLLHTFGELAVSPVGLSYITKLAPRRLVGQVMGLWFLSNSLGNLAAGLAAGGFSADNVAAFPAQFLAVFALAAGAALILVLLARPVRRLMAGVV